MNPLEFVRAYPPFDRLPQEALKRLEQGLEVSFYPAKTRMLQQDGPRSSHLYLIRKGEAHLEREGREVLHLEEGDLFGYPSLLSQDAPSFDVVADEDVLAYRWPDEVFQQLLGYRAFAEFFTRGLAERLRLSARSTTGAFSTVNLDLSLPVGELVSRPPIFVRREASVGEAAQVMKAQQISSILVEGGMGIVTDRDLRNRVLALGKGPETPIAEVMSAPLKTLPSSTPLFEALSYMVSQGIHHLPLEEESQLVGVISDTVFMRRQARSPLYLLRRLERTQNLQELKGYAQDLTALAESLFFAGLGASETGRSISALNDQLIRTLLRLAEARLGPPPTPYAWIVFGSEGRMEQALLTDQDNALIYAEEVGEAQAYFQQLAEFVVGGLLEAGFPPCPGGYMATHWRKPLVQWEELFRSWIETPNPQELLEAQIFFDYRTVHGELSLEPLGQIIHQSRQHGLFLAQLARASLLFRPPIGFFRQIKEEEGGMDLKKGGIAPIVSLARVYALEAGSRAKATVERLRIAAAEGKISQQGAELLGEAFAFLMRLRLREQLAAIRRGEAPSNKVPLEHLSPLERRHLKEVFLEIRQMQEALSGRFHTNQLG